MKIDKAELSQKIKKLKNIVPVKTYKTEIQGILVQNGYMTASNTELTVKAKTEEAEKESFVIPLKAFDLINNLPNGEVEITAGQNNGAYIISIKAAKIKNKYQVTDPSLFPLPQADCESEEEVTIDSELLLTSMKRVSYAVAANAGAHILKAMYLHASGGMLNFVGSDSHVLAWDKVEFDGNFKLLIPKAAIEKLTAIGISGKVCIRHSKASAVFVSEGYEIHTRIMEGEYLRYQSIFKEFRLHTVISRVELLEAMTRAKMCTEEKCPVKFAMEGGALNLSIKDRMTDYDETLDLQEELSESLTIAFDAGLVLETLKAFDCDNVRLSFESPKMPMIVEAEDSDFRAIVLPVAIS